MGRRAAARFTKIVCNPAAKAAGLQTGLRNAARIHCTKLVLNNKFFELSLLEIIFNA
jgi:hypothetical protein